MTFEIDDVEIDLSGAEILQVPTALKKFIKISGNDLKLDTSVVALAEEAINTLASESPKWMALEIENLREQHGRFLDSRVNAANARTFYLALHNMKGQALNLGYPLVGQIAGSLCDVFEAMPSENVSPQLIDYHVNAICALVSANAKGADNETAKSILKKLQMVSRVYLSEIRERNKASA